MMLVEKLYYALLSATISFINHWIAVERACWLGVGFVGGFFLGMAIWNWRSRISLFWHFLFAATVLFQPFLHWFLPTIAYSLVGQIRERDWWHILVYIGGLPIGLIGSWFFHRWWAPKVDRLVKRLVAASGLVREGKTDIRTLVDALGDAVPKFDPRDYFDFAKGIFLGLAIDMTPVYTPTTKWNSAHHTTVGSTGCGKTSGIAGELYQVIQLGHSVWVYDPKDDEFLPHVLYAAARQKGVNYYYIDLVGEVPQWNPIEKKTAQHIDEMLCAGFSMGEKGTEADFYRLNDRKACRSFCHSLGQSQPRLYDAAQSFIGGDPSWQENAAKFCADLEEIALLPVTQICNGFDIEKAVRERAVVYVRCTMRNPAVTKLQRILLVSLMQFCESRPRTDATPVTIFKDEFKYTISRPALQALGTIRDKRANVIVAHQSFGDLRDCPQDLDPESVTAAINENCSIKRIYRVNDPDTADLLARLSGTILVDDEQRLIRTDTGLVERLQTDRTVRQSERPLIDQNMLMTLPDRCAVIFGLGIAQIVITSPIPVKQTVEAITPTRFMVEIPVTTPSAPSIAQSMLDVD